MSELPAESDYLQPLFARYLREASERLRQGRLAEARSCALLASGLRPDDPRPWNLRARIAHAEGDLPAARALVRQAIERAPGRTVFHLHEGRISEALGDIEAAIAAYQRAVEQRPQLVEARLRLADALLAAGRRQAAAALYRQLAAALTASFRPAAASAQTGPDRPYAVTVFTPPKLPMMPRLLQEVAEALCYGLRELGLEAVMTWELGPATARRIVLGTGCLPNAVPLGCSAAPVLGADSILYQLEQFSGPGHLLRSGLVPWLASFPAWDFSQTNLAAQRLAGLTQGRHVPLGYVPQLTRIAERRQDIDVLFYGHLSARRQRILEALHSRGVKVKYLVGVYGAERDAYIARAKLVLNVHHYSARIFEAARVVYLLANRKCVVSETGRDPAEREFAAGVAFADYGQLVATCLQLLEAPAERDRLAEAGFQLVCKRPMAAYLGAALAGGEGGAAPGPDEGRL